MCESIIFAAWWYKPEYIITELNTNSAITTPCHEEILAINSWTTQTPYTLKGYAYSGKFLFSFFTIYRDSHVYSLVEKFILVSYPY